MQGGEEGWRRNLFSVVEENRKVIVPLDLINKLFNTLINMVTPEVYEQKATELSNQILETMEKFSKKNFDLPPQIIMAALAELLIQFSVGQVGKDETLRLISHLKESVEMFGDGRSPQH